MRQHHPRYGFLLMEREFVAIRRIDARNFTLVATVDIFLSLGMPTLYAADIVKRLINTTARRSPLYSRSVCIEP